MTKILSKEYKEGDQAVLITEVTFLGIPIFKCKRTTTNNQVVSTLISINQPTEIKGFV